MAAGATLVVLAIVGRSIKVAYEGRAQASSAETSQGDKLIRDEVRYWIGEPADKIKQRFGKPLEVVNADDGKMMWRYVGITKNADGSIVPTTNFVIDFNRVSAIRFAPK